MARCPWMLLIALLVVRLDAAEVFVPPDPVQRAHAIGATDDLPPLLQRALEPAGFAPIPAPGRSDWLSHFSEPGQSAHDFRRERHAAPTPERRTIYLQPLGDFPAARSPDIERLRRFVAAYFMVPAALLPARPLADGAFGERRNPGDGQRQLLTTAVLEAMVRDKPADAFAVVELTMVDLYPDPAWNFVFGQARPTDAVGIFSFARYAPDGDALTPAQGTRLLTRSCQVLAHEIGHLFGIDHCIWFHCVMNGANHLQESDLQPMHCCPVDLRKLQAATGCDVLERYRGLQALCAQWGLAEEQAWLDAEIDRLAK